MDRRVGNAWFQTLSSRNYISSDKPRREFRNCSSNAPAIFETKTTSACPTRYNLRHQKAMESRSIGIKSEYVRKVEEIDVICTGNAVS